MPGKPARSRKPQKKPHARAVLAAPALSRQPALPNRSLRYAIPRLSRLFGLARVLPRDAGRRFFRDHARDHHVHPPHAAAVLYRRIFCHAFAGGPRRRQFLQTQGHKAGGAVGAVHFSGRAADALSRLLQPVVQRAGLGPLCRFLAGLYNERLQRLDHPDRLRGQPAIPPDALLVYLGVAAVVCTAGHRSRRVE